MVELDALSRSSTSMIRLTGHLKFKGCGIRLALLILTFAILSPCTKAQVCCTQAQSETSQVAGDVLDPYDAEDFLVTVADTNRDNFSGRYVQESDYRDGRDTCWFSGNTISLTYDAHVDGSSWQVNANNQYGYDTIGWTLAAVNYIRANAPAHGVPLPCGATLYQLMDMECFGGLSVKYSANVLSETITPNTEVSCRQGICRTVFE